MAKLEAKLCMALPFWNDLISSLKERGEGRRESGAFILSNSNIAQKFILYDDLDPDCLDTGAIHFKGRGYVKLWDYCLANGMRVIADVHTHPFKWTNQSGIDESNPMISQKGHLGLIVPYYAAMPNQDLKGVGIFEYLGDYEWKKWNAKSGIIKILRT